MATNLKSYIGMSVRAARERRGWTQEQLAEQVEKAVETISNIERGFSHTTLPTLERLAEALGVHISELFPADPAYGSGALERHRKERELVLLARTLSDSDLDVALRQMKALAERG